MGFAMLKFLGLCIFFLIQVNFLVMCRSDKNNSTSNTVNKTRIRGQSAENRVFQDPTTGCGIQRIQCDLSELGHWCSPNSRIIGGSETYRGEFPWMVLLVTAHNYNRKQFCAGTLLDSQHVLTANHCVFDYDAKGIIRLRAILGDHNILTTADGRHEERRISHIFRHPKWNIKTNEHDIAILKLRRPVNFTDYIQPICLSEMNVEDLMFDNFNNYHDNEHNDNNYYQDFQDEGNHRVYVTIAGWGRTNLNSTKKSPTLMKTMIPLKNHEECRKVYDPYVITRNMFCAGGDGEDACMGDSGGPLMHKNHFTGRWEQLGIISWGNNCYSLPGVYTRIENYLSWIEKTIRESRRLPATMF